ncbi:hypothetical protein [uncultured Bacteroides sp.]|uniref:hypothetical protein n=1 Tax=uncultured Bacteroides sp. TaxID=162156 RepID=UPI0025AA1748|nr:hypothetical protein [uncultured Bacteroides sp.]
MRSTIFSFFGILSFCLLLLLAAMKCEEDEEVLPPVLADVVGVRLVLLDNSGHAPEPITTAPRRPT